MDETQTIGDTNLFQVPKFIDKKYGLEVCTIDLFGRDPERSMECNFLLFFPQSQLCCRAVPSIRHNIISKDQIIVRRSIPEYCGRCKYFREMIWLSLKMYKKFACRSKFEKLGLFFVLSKCNVLGWVWFGLGLGLGGVFFFGVLFWQLFFGSSAQMGKIVANYYSNMVLQHVKGHHLEFHLRLSVLAYLTGTPFLISFCNGLLPSDR